MSEIEPHNVQVVERPADPYQIDQNPQNQSMLVMVAGVLRRWYIVLLVFIVVCGAGLPAIWLKIEPLHNMTGAIRVAPILPNILTGEADQHKMSTYETFMHTQAALIGSSRVIERVADRLADDKLLVFENPPVNPVQKLKNKVKGIETNTEPAVVLKQLVNDGIVTIEPGRRTELITITMQSESKSEAKRVVDAFIDSYMAVEVSEATSEEADKLNVLQNERDVLAEKMKRKRDTIRQLAQEYGTTALGGRQEIMLESVSNILSELVEIESTRRRLEVELDLLEQTKDKPQSPPERLLNARQEYINQDSTVRTLAQTIIELEQSLIAARQNLAPGNPTLKQKEQLIEQLQQRMDEVKEDVGKRFDESFAGQIAKTGEGRLEAKKAELEKTSMYEERFREKLNEVNEETIQMGRKQLTINDLKDELAMDKEMYERIGRRIQELQMQRKRPARISVAYRAELSHTRDKRLKLAAALLFGAFACGGLVAFLLDKADKSIRSPEDITRRVNTRIIGTTIDAARIKRNLLPKQIEDDFQTINANLGLLNGQSIPRTLVVTSPGMQDGKTTLAINLASSMAKIGKRVLLIDGDLRKPDVGRMLHLSQDSNGLQYFLFGGDFNRAVYSSHAIGFDVLTANSRNAGDASWLLRAPNMKESIKNINTHYDHVIIDTPPVLAFPDALIWAKVSDAVILTSFSGQTSSNDLKETQQKLNDMGIKVLGTVLNGVGPRQSYYRYSKYGYSYRRYKQRGATDRKKASTKLLIPVREQNSADSAEQPKTPV